MPRSFRGGQSRRTIQKLRAVVEAELEAEQAAQEDEEDIGELVDALPFKELRTFAKDHGISAGGSREEIIARISATFSRE